MIWGLDRHVQRRHRLVTDQQLRLQDQGAREDDALALAAAEFVRIFVQLLVGQPDRMEKLAGLGLVFLPAAELVHGQRFDHLFQRPSCADRGRREDPGTRIGHVFFAAAIPSW